MWGSRTGVLSLANAGATGLALDKYYEFGLDKRHETDVRSLLGRLKKDQAFAETGAARDALFREGRAIYEDAFRNATAAGDPEAYYPAINAASLALFGGDAEAASRLAGEVLDLLAPRIASLDDVAGDRYWVLATALEAQLVRGDLDAARELVDQIVAAAGSSNASSRRRTCVYVTETFAAMLALHNADQFACDYVGNSEMAKHYGRLRMFLLRRGGDGKGPPVLGDIERAAD